MAATIGVIFGAPLFAFVQQIEDEYKPASIAKNMKMLMYFVGILSEYGVLTILQNIFGERLGLGRFPAIEKMIGTEWTAVILLLLICFPVNGIIPMTIGAVIGGAISVPKWFAVVEDPESGLIQQQQ